MHMAKSFMTPAGRSSRRRGLSLALAGFTLTLLAACGGGGTDQSDLIGGVPPPVVTPVPPPTTPPPPPTTPPPAPVPTGSMTVDSTSCEVVTPDTNSCPIPVAVTSANVSSALAVVATASGQAFPVSGINTNAGTATVNVPLGENIEYKLKDGNNALGNVLLLSASCAATIPLNPATGNCETPKPTVLHYDRANLVTTGEVIADTGNGTLGVAYPQLIVGTTLTPLKNETGVQVGLCMLSATILGPEAGASEGLPSVACVQPQLGNIRAVFPIDPVGKKLLPKIYDYTARPDGAVYYAAGYSEFGDSPYTVYNVNRLGHFIDVPGVGTYYFTGDQTDELRLTRDGFKTYEVVQTGQFMILLMTYTNPEQ